MSHLARHDRDTAAHGPSLRTAIRAVGALVLGVTVVSTDWASVVFDWAFMLGLCGLLLGADLVGIQ